MVHHYTFTLLLISTKGHIFCIDIGAYRFTIIIFKGYVTVYMYNIL